MIDLNDYVRIFEDGVYKGCQELSKYILKHILENKSQRFFVFDSSELDFPNIFFKTLYVKLDVKDNVRENIRAAYVIEDDPLVADLIKWNYETESFNYIKLNILIDDFKDLKYHVIGHELTHAYEDYKIRKDSKNTKSINSYKNEKYYIANEFLSSKDINEQVVGFIEYASTGTETRAFVAQAMMNLKDNLDKYSTFDEAIEYQIVHNEVFYMYAVFCNAFYKNKENERNKQIIIDTYRKIYKNNKESENKILKRLENKLNEFRKALIKHIKTILNDYAKKNA